MEQRISEWLPVRADGKGLNIEVIRYEDRADKDAWPSGDGKVWRLKDAASTRDGSWETVGLQWGMVQWFRDTYLKPVDDPHHCDAGGADHNIIVALLDEAGNFIGLSTAKVMQWWYDALTAPNTNTSTDSFAWKTTDGKGWLDFIMAGGSGGSLYYPEQGQHGPYKIAINGASDVVWGFGMPVNNHVSDFLVFQLVSGDPLPPDPPPADGTVRSTILAARQAALDAVTACDEVLALLG